MCNSSNNKYSARITSPCTGYANGRLVNGTPNGLANGYLRTSDVQHQLNTSDRVMSEKIEMFRGVSYYVIHEGPSSSPYVILKKVQ